MIELSIFAVLFCGLGFVLAGMAAELRSASE